MELVWRASVVAISISDRVSMLICEKTTTLIFLDLELVHHFIDRQLVIRLSSFKNKAKVMLQLTVSRSVRLGVRHLSGTRDQLFFLLEISLDSCGFVIL
jgi:hypothetical protein